MRFGIRFDQIRCMKSYGNEVGKESEDKAVVMMVLRCARSSDLSV